MKNLFIILFFCSYIIANSQTFDEIYIEEIKWEAEGIGIDWKRYLYFSNLYSESLKRASKKYSIPITLIEAIITVESNWDANAKGKNNCNGLMQIRGGSFNPHINILNGTEILKHYLKKCKNDTAKALTSYNRGFTGMKKHYKKYGRASNYALRILKIFEFYKEIKDDS